MGLASSSIIRLPSAHRIVLGVLYRMTECTVAAGNQSDDPARRHAEGGWNLGGVEHAQPSAGACSHIEEASAPLHPFDDGSDQTFDLGDALMDCQSHLAALEPAVGPGAGLLHIVSGGRYLDALVKSHGDVRAQV